MAELVLEISKFMVLLRVGYKHGRAYSHGRALKSSQFNRFNRYRINVEPDTSQVLNAKCGPIL